MKIHIFFRNLGLYKQIYLIRLNGIFMYVHQQNNFFFLFVLQLFMSRLVNEHFPWQKKEGSRVKTTYKAYNLLLHLCQQSLCHVFTRKCKEITISYITPM